MGWADSKGMSGEGSWDWGEGTWDWGEETWEWGEREDGGEMGDIVSLKGSNGNVSKRMGRVGEDEPEDEPWS